MRSISMRAAFARPFVCPVIQFVHPDCRFCIAAYRSHVGKLDMVLHDHALHFHVVLTKDMDTRTWQIRFARDCGNQARFRRGKPGSFTVGALPTMDAVEAKRREFEDEIEDARAEGWR